MRPRSGTGANTAERVPSTMRAWPLKASRHARKRSWSVSAECSMAMGTPKRSRKRPTSCGVRAISGTSTSARRPASSTRPTRRRYTSVLPLPVIPWSTKARKVPSCPATASTAACCSAKSSGPGARPPALCAGGSVGTSTLAIQPRGRERPGGLAPRSEARIERAGSGGAIRTQKLQQRALLRRPARLTPERNSTPAAVADQRSSFATALAPWRSALGRALASTSPIGWW